MTYSQRFILKIIAIILLFTMLPTGLMFVINVFLILTITMQNRYYYPYIAVEETEAIAEIT